MTLDNLSLRLQEMVPHFSQRGYAVVPVPENLYSTLLEIFIEGRYMFDGVFAGETTRHCRKC